MKISPAQSERFVKSPTAHAILIYGPDAGMVVERGKNIVKNLGFDPADTFAVVRLNGTDIESDPPRLVDEVKSLPMMVDRKIVWVKYVTDKIAAALDGVFEAVGDNALVLIEAGDLKPTSKLRKAFEVDKAAATLACYADDAGTLRQFIQQHLSEQGFQADTDAIQKLMAILGVNRALTVQELDKLMVYKGSDKIISLADVTAIVTNASGDGLDDLMNAVGAGNLPYMTALYTKMVGDGESPVHLLNSLGRHFNRLYEVRVKIDGSTPAKTAMKQIRPPVFWKQENAFMAQTNKVSGARFAKIMDSITQANMACRTTGAMIPQLTERTYLRITSLMGR